MCATAANGTFLLGGYKDIMCSAEAASECHGIISGEVADLNLWSRAWTEAEMLSYTGCLDAGSGDILSWAEAGWETVNVVVEEDAELRDICNEKEESFVVFPERRSFHEISGFCRTMGAEMAAPATVAEQEALHTVVKAFISKVNLLVHFSFPTFKPSRPDFSLGMTSHDYCT